MAKLFVRESLLQQREGNKIPCSVCERRCLLGAGAFGWCRTRQNRGGRLVTLIYGCVSSLSANPIKKKPFYHFHPGSFALTAGSWSCNFGCPWCHNWEISMTAPPTPVAALERAWRIGKDAGLKFVYVGNVPCHTYNNTYCPACDTLLIRRFGFEVARNTLRNGCCPQCARSVAGVWGKQATSSMQGGAQLQNRMN